MLFAGLGSVRIVKNCDLGLENAVRGGFGRHFQDLTVLIRIPSSETHKNLGAETAQYRLKIFFDKGTDKKVVFGNSLN